MMTGIDMFEILYKAEAATLLLLLLKEGPSAFFVTPELGDAKLHTSPGLPFIWTPSLHYQ